jgi:2-octaprenylphenol hydroxylase
MKLEPLIYSDVVIVGAGLVGMAAAIAIHHAGLKVILVDAKNPAQTFAKDNGDLWDQKIYAISPKNVQWLKSLDVWQHIDETRVGRMQAMQIWGDVRATPLLLAADDANQDDLALIVENKALMQAMLKQLQHCEIQTIYDSPGEQLALTSSEARLKLTKQTIESALLLAADGAHSWVRTQADVFVNRNDYEQIAIVANFEVEKSHAHTAMQWFAHDDKGQNNILAFLPLPGNRISIVWSVARQYGQELLALTSDAFIQRLMEASGRALGDMTMITPPASFPLALQTSAVMTQSSSVFIGDAAHQIHPLAGQGMNLGFRDVIDLIEILKSRNPYQTINDPSLLKRYSRVRKEDIYGMQLLTDGLYRLFANRNSAVKAVRNWGLGVVDNSTVKKLLVEKAIAL